MINSCFRAAVKALSLSAALLSAPALAAPGDTATEDGAAQANVVNPTGMINTRDLRFGAFVSPTTASTLRIDPDGTVAPSGDVANTYLITQPADGRGPGQFLITGDQARAFLIFAPNRINISNGTSTMRVRRFRFSTRRNTPITDPNAAYDLDVGGTLDINANQEVGRYTGTYDITVVYL